MTSTPKATLLQLPPSSDVSSAEREICWKRTFEENLEWESWMGTLNGNLEWKPWMGTWWKIFNPMRETGEKNRETTENILAPCGSWWVSRGHVSGEKPLHLVVGNWGRKPDKGINRWKTSQLMMGTREENQKSIKCRYHQWKILPTWIKDREGKT